VALDTKNMQIIYELYENGALFSKNAHQKSMILIVFSKQSAVLWSQKLKPRFDQTSLQKETKCRKIDW